MARKKKSSLSDEAAAQERARRDAIREYNLNNAGSSWIDPDKVPTEDDVIKAKEDFENAVTELKEKKYLIADSANAERVVNFLKDFLKDCFWTQNLYIGVLNFNGLLDDTLKDFSENGVSDFMLDYAPMQFGYIILENFAGIGLEAADKMARKQEEYVAIHDTFKDNVESFNNEQKRCELLKERWAMLEEGYYLVIIDGNESDEGCNNDENRSCDANADCCCSEDCDCDKCNENA